jgi:hypothetical protein
MSGSEQRFQAEPDAPPSGRIMIQMLALVVILVGVLIGLWQFFQLNARQEIFDKELSLPSRDLLELRARERGLLTQYAALDAKSGVYQIPVRRAMELLLANPSLLENPTPQLQTTPDGSKEGR